MRKLKGIQMPSYVDGERYEWHLPEFSCAVTVTVTPYPAVSGVWTDWDEGAEDWVDRPMTPAQVRRIVQKAELIIPTPAGNVKVAHIMRKQE